VQSLTSEEPGLSPTCSQAILARSHCASLGETLDEVQEAKTGRAAKAQIIQKANLGFIGASFPGRACALYRQARSRSPRNAHCRAGVASCRRKYFAIAPVFLASDRYWMERTGYRP